MPPMCETNVTTMLSVGHAAERRYRHQFRDGSSKAWDGTVFLVVVDRRNGDVGSKPSPTPDAEDPDAAAARLQT